MKQINETLYGEPKNGTVKQWAVYTQGDKVIVQWGRKDGKLQTKETICTPKNVGRSNETTSEQQALLEAEAKWTKQHDNKLYRTTVEDAKKVGGLLPMLAIDGSKKPEKIKYPCFGQVKLDGLRCMVYLEDGEVKAISRQGKFYELHQELSTALKDLMDCSNIHKLDGELYKHGMMLQDIVSAARSVTNPKHRELEYHIFDVPSDEAQYLRRHDLNQLMFSNISSFVDIVNLVTVNDEGDMHRYLDEALTSNYEGLILRNYNGLYQYNHRSNDLIKVKVMQDSEALVTGCREDKNGEGVLTCSWNGVTFDVKMKGTHETRKYSEQVTLIERWINFTYQALTKDGKPQFPVGQYVRECNNTGQPLN